MNTEILNGEEPDEINLWKTLIKSGWQGILERQLEQAKEAEKNGKPNYFLLANLSSELGQREESFAYLEKSIVQIWDNIYAQSSSALRFAARRPAI